MYHPEFRYLITEDNDNREMMMPFINGYVFAAIIVSVLSLLIVVGGIFTAFTLTSLIVIPLFKYLWTIFWNVLTPGNQWLEIVFIITSIVAFSGLIRTMEGVSNQLDMSFTKLKTEIAERNEKIAKLELEILKMKESLQSTALRLCIKIKKFKKIEMLFLPNNKFIKINYQSSI